MKQNPPTYLVCYPREYGTMALAAIRRGDYTTIGFADTLAEAQALRMLSGDIVVRVATKEVETNTAWLWEWERESKNNAFAWQMIVAQRCFTKEALDTAPTSH